ncbi:hypothetical protein [Nitrosopumilus sp.]|uniref:hypothetical protein n=1 Tax=Nitrosopumilus sp. TaxID=2024843 RepID=UPI0034A03443
MKYLLFPLLLLLSVSLPLAFSDAEQQMEFDQKIEVALTQVRAISDILENDYLTSDALAISHSVESVNKMLKSELSSMTSSDVVKNKESVSKLVELQQEYIDIQNSVRSTLDSEDLSPETLTNLTNLSDTAKTSEIAIVEFIASGYADAAPAKIFPSVQKITLTYYINDGFKNLYGADAQPVKFSLINSTNVQPKDLSVVFTELINRDEVRFVGSTSDTKYNDQKLHISKSSRGITHISYDVFGEKNSGFKYEGTYVGKIYITGSNFDTQAIDVEITAKENPWNLFYIAWIGIGLSALAGFGFTVHEKRSQKKSKDQTDSEIIGIINLYIERWNGLSTLLQSNNWSAICKMATQTINNVISKRDKLKLNPDDVDVKWFERFDSEIDKKIIHGMELMKSTETLDVILKPNDADNIATFPSEKQELIRAMMAARTQSAKDQIKEKAKSEFNGKKVFYFVSTAIIALPSSVFLADTFVGASWLNYAIFFATGFGIYRIQDIATALYPKKS